MIEELLLLFIPLVGLLLIGAFVWWQNERDYKRYKNEK